MFSFSKFITIVLIFAWIIYPAIAGEREEYSFAYSLFQREAYGIAKDQFKAFLQEYPDSENADNARILMGDCALQLKGYDEAIRHYKQLEIDYPDSPLRLDAVFGVATAWFRQGKYEEAIKAFEEVIEESNDDQVIPQSLYLVGESYDNLGLYQKAGEYYNRVLAKYPQSPKAVDALYARGWSLYRLKKYQAAYGVFTRFIKTYSNHYAVVEASYRAAESLFKLGDWANAQTAYQKFVGTYRIDEKHRQSIINARFRLGECYFQQQLMEEAKGTFQLLLQEHGTSPIAAEAQYWIAEILLEGEKYPEAIYEYGKIVNLHPKSDVVDDAQFGIATAYFRQGDYVKARAQFQVVADNLRSDLADAARFHIGQCFSLQREFNSAILNYKKVGSKSPYADDALYELATSAFELQDYSQATRTLNELLQSYSASPLVPYTLHQLGLAYFNQAEYQQSVEVFDRFFEAARGEELETAPLDEALFWKARALYELGNYSEVIQTCMQLLQHFPNSRQYDAEFFIAESTYWSQQTLSGFQSTRQKYQALLDKQPEGKWAEKCRYGIGWTQFSEATLSKNEATSANHYQSAINAWGEVIKNHSAGEFADQAQYHIGVAYINLKQHNDAIDAFNRLISGYPGSNWGDDARFHIGWALYKQEKYQQTILAFDEMLKKHSGSQFVPKAIFGIANAYFKQGKFAKAVKNYQRVVNEFPNPISEPGTEKIVDLRPEAQYYIAESYLSLRNYAEAIHAYGKVIQHYPASEWADDAQYGVALAYKNLGQKEKAMQAYRTLIQRYASGELAPDAQIEIADFYYQDKDYTRAIAEFQDAINRYPNAPEASLAQYNIGKSYIALASYRQAITAFERVDSTSEIAAAAAYEIGYAWYNNNNPSRNLGNAVNALLRVAQEFPKNPDAPRALLLAGRCYQELAEWDKAVGIYPQIIESYPRSEEAIIAQLELGHTYRTQGKFQNAIAAYDVIRKAGEDEYPLDIVIEAILYLAETQTKDGNYEDGAITYLRIPLLYEQYDLLTTLEATVRAADAFTTSGKIYMAKDTFADAIKLYEVNASTVQDSNIRKHWDKLYDTAKTRFQQLIRRIERE